MLTLIYLIKIDLPVKSVAFIARKHHPELKDKPVAVCHTTTKTTAWGQGTFREFSASEISSCSYEARAKNVKAGMYFGTAKNLCPELIAVAYDFDETKKVAQQFYDILIETFHAHNIEPVSCDEVYIDVSRKEDLEKCVQKLRNDVVEVTGCVCSLGGGSNAISARLATKTAKPNGYLLLAADNEKNFILDQKFADIPGIGPTTLERFAQSGYSKSLTVRKFVQNSRDGIQALMAICGSDLTSKIERLILGTFRS